MTPTRHRPRPDWPSTEHRSLAQVKRTVELRTMPRKLSTLELEELRYLAAKEEAFNPPPEDRAGAA